MTYDEAVAAGLGPYITKPGENIKPLSEATEEDLKPLLSEVPVSKEQLEKWVYDDTGNVVILDQ